jgi:phage terminase large subunit-like protein
MKQIAPTPEQFARWRRDPCAFIEEVLFNPETGKPFVLLDAERDFLRYAYDTDADGRLLFPEQLYAAPKKSGKTGFAALHMLTTTLLYGGRFSEAYALANDQEQAVSRVYQAISRIVEASPLLACNAEIMKDRIVFSKVYGNATVAAISSDYAGAAGANPVISCFDELWAFKSENSRRLWDEMVPPPTRKITCRLTVTYAGFEGESDLLQELYQRGLKQPEVGKSLRAGDGILMAWHHEPIAPWQTDSWLAEMRRSLRANQFLRMIQNQFVTSESSFIDIEKWDAIVDRNATPTLLNKDLPVYIGIDASVKHDSTAIVAVTFDKETQRVRLVSHKVFQPSPDEPLDFEATIEATVLDMSRRFDVKRVLYDPFQMQHTSQRLRNARIRIDELPQTVGNLTSIGQNLFDLIEARQLSVYPDAAMRLAVAHSVAVETPRGFRITKTSKGHKIDSVIALAMACWATVDMGMQEQKPMRFVVGDQVLTTQEMAARTNEDLERATFINNYQREQREIRRTKELYGHLGTFGRD